jgi:predicted nucleic acid-binding protein
MRINPYIALLDACVLVPMPVADTLFRLAEEPAFYTPKWSPDILEEVQRTLSTKLNRTSDQVVRRMSFMRDHFPDAVIDGYQGLIEAMKNNPKDRHVLAAAITGGANAIVTNNVRHFPCEALSPYGIECLNADKFIELQYHLDPDLFISVLTQQAEDIGRTLPQLLAIHVPSLSKLIVTAKE